MIGHVVVMEPADVPGWLADRRGGGAGAWQARAGVARRRNSFRLLRPATAATGARGPSLAGLFGKTVQLQNGETVVADETYIRESILNPQAKVVAGYQPIMPTFQGLVSEEQLLQLIAYIKSLRTSRDGRRGTAVGMRTVSRTAEDAARDGPTT